MLLRTITALGLFIAALLIMFVAPSYVFNAFSWLICLLIIHELTTMYQFTMWQKILSLLINTALALAVYLVHYDFSQIIMMIAIFTWCFIVPFVLIFQPKNFSKTAIVVFSIILTIPAFYGLVVINSLFGGLQLLYIFFVAWIADTGAYFTGKAFGKRKLIPSVSPNKTVEGLIGGFICVVIYMNILYYFNLSILLPSYGKVMKIALILTAVSVIGDLVESWFKRVAKVKDSGNILPGHGGVFDRMDSIIAVVAISYAMLRGMI